MVATNRTATFLGSATLIAAITAFLIGSGPFSPGLAMAAAAVPLAVVTALLGAWRLALAALYWAITAFVPVLLSRATDVRVDYVLVFLGAIGVLILLGLYFHYRASRRLL